jgi:hypothetical protein
MNCYIMCYANSKIPVGENWGARPLSTEEVARRLANNPTANVGILLGPISGLIDVECDGEEATAAYTKHLGCILTPSWQSTRGKHYLYQYDERLTNLANALHVDSLGGLEFRLGNGKATQSIAPPSIVDGVRREWIVSTEQCTPARLPEEIIQTLLTLPPAAKRRKAQADIPETRKAKVDRLLSYCRRVGLPVVGVREDHDWGMFIDLFPCPFKCAGHEEGGYPAIIVHPDGNHSFKCFHLKCNDKKWDDIEEAYGPLLPVVTVKTQLDSAVAGSIRALSTEPNTYQHGVLVEIAHDAPKPKLCKHDNGSPRLRPIPAATLTVKLSSCARFRKWSDKKDDYVPCLPPETVVNAVLQSINFSSVPVITGIVSSPILRADGTIATKPGYDSGTGMYLDIEGEFPPLMQPKDAIALLDDVLVDFPFASPAHESGWFAALVTLLSRSAFSGSAPFFLVDANISRVGKGLLTDALMMIFEGRKATRYSAPNDQDELRKAITSVALGGSPYMLFDNIKGKFGGATLENAMTAGRWFDRVLGLNRNADLPLNIVWLGTSNNAALTKDMIGRTLHIRLETDHENPAVRTDFKYDDLLGHIKDHRLPLAMAALSLPAGYVNAGRPDMQLPGWGGFDDWSKLVRNSLVWAGLADPGETRDGLAAEADEETLQLRQLMDAWAELGRPATVNDAAETAYNGVAPLLKAFLDGLPGDKSGKKTALGNLLRDYRGRVLDRRRLERTDNKRPKWRVVNLDARETKAPSGEPKPVVDMTVPEMPDALV